MDPTSPEIMSLVFTGTLVSTLYSDAFTLVSYFPASQITQFILTPSSSPPAQESSNTSFFWRALSVIKSYSPSHSNSFTLCRVLHPPKRDGVSSPPPPYRWNASVSSVEQLPTSFPPPPDIPTITSLRSQRHRRILNSPLLVFHDQTPLLTLRSLTGLIELNQVEEQTLGVDTSFWIAIALTYLEFLEERILPFRNPLQSAVFH
jgi:hypothetical protein